MNLRGFIVLALILASLVFLLPLIVYLVAFFLIAAAVLMLLARLGVLQNVFFKTYTFQGERRAPSSRERTVYFEDEPVPSQAEKAGWYQEMQEGETIVLPEDALKKEKDKE